MLYIIFLTLTFAHTPHTHTRYTLQCHNGSDGVSNPQPHHCLLNRVFRRWSKKTSKLGVAGICARNSPGTSPHKWPVTRKMSPFDDVIMYVEHQWVIVSLTSPSLSHLLSTYLFYTQPMPMGDLKREYLLILLKVNLNIFQTILQLGDEQAIVKYKI